jgi:hypothetical protein
MPRRWQRMLDSLGIDPVGFAALVRAFLLMDLRGQHYARATASQPHFAVSPLFWVIGQCLALSAALSLILFARVDVFFFVLANLSASLLILPATLIVEFSEVVQNPVDLEILGHRPISPRTYAAARMVNLFFYVGLIYLALNVFPLILGAGLRDAGALYVPGYLLASLTASLFLTCLVIWVLSAGGRSRKLEPVKEVLAWTQILLLLVVGYGAQLMLRDGAEAVFYWGAFPPPWVRYLPSAWLAHFVERVHDPDGGILLIALALAAVGVISLALTFARLVRLYRILQPEPAAVRARPMVRQRLGGVGGWILAALLPRREERIGFWLCRTFLVRETGLKMRCLWPLNLAAAVIVLGLLVGQFANPLLERDPRTIALPALAVWLTACTVPAIVYNLCFSGQHQAIWLIRGAPLEQPAGVARGVCKAVMALVVGPWCLLLGLIAGLTWQDPLAAMLHASLAWALSWPLALTGLWLVAPAAPFSLAPVHGAATGPLALPLAVLSGAVLLGASLHCLWADSLWFWTGCFLFSVAASALLRRQADRRMNRLCGGPA